MKKLAGHGDHGGHGGHGHGDKPKVNERRRKGIFKRQSTLGQGMAKMKEKLSAEQLKKEAA